MSKYQLQFNVASGAVLLLGFDSVAELEERLRELDLTALEQVISTNLKEVVKREPRKVKPALEGICMFREDGSLEFLRPASSKVEAMALALYAYDPEPVELQILGKLASEKNPAAYVGAKAYAKFFQKTDSGVYRLSQDGKVWVADTIILKMKG
jgi:hypothetical protein